MITEGLFCLFLHKSIRCEYLVEASPNNYPQLMFYGEISKIIFYHMSLVVRKPVFGVSDHV